MSLDRLEAVKKLEQLGFDQWVALATKVGGLDAVKAILRGTSAVTVEVVRHLSKSVPVTVSSSTRNLVDFYQTGVGLWLSPNFQNHILKGVTTGKVKTPNATINYADFVQAANDAEVCKDMPVGYVFKNRDLFLGYLATLISFQPGGMAGLLLCTDFKANIFHVEFEREVPFAVYVNWYPDVSRWYCYANPHDSYRWGAGRRVFGNCH